MEYFTIWELKMPVFKSFKGHSSEILTVDYNWLLLLVALCAVNLNVFFPKRATDWPRTGWISPEWKDKPNVHTKFHQKIDHPFERYRATDVHNILIYLCMYVDLYIIHWKEKLWSSNRHFARSFGIQVFSIKLKPM